MKVVQSTALLISLSPNWQSHTDPIKKECNTKVLEGFPPLDHPLLKLLSRISVYKILSPRLTGFHSPNSGYFAW